MNTPLEIIKEILSDVNNKMMMKFGETDSFYGLISNGSYFTVHYFISIYDHKHLYTMYELMEDPKKCKRDITDHFENLEQCEPRIVDTPSKILEKLHAHGTDNPEVEWIGKYWRLKKPDE